MRWALLLVAGLVATPAGAADLSALDRTVRTEPAYAGKPRYCLLVFGPDARERVWLVRDGDTLYVDRNGNGDLTEPGEAIATKREPGRDPEEFGDAFEVGELRVGGRVHTGLAVTAAPLARPNARAVPAADPKARADTVTLNVDRPGVRGAGTDGRVVVKAGAADGSGALLFADKPADAPIIHLDGPLQVAPYGEKPALKLERDTDFVLAVGTPGLGAGTFAMLADDRAVPDTAVARVEILFPPTKEGDAPVRERYDLKGRCWGYNLHGTVRPPPAAGVGDAVATVALDSWPGVSVAPTTHPLAVARPKAGATAEPVSNRLTRSLLYPARTATVMAVRFSADGSRLLTAGNSSGVLQFWDVATGKELRRIETPPGHRGFPGDNAMPGDWSTLYVPRETSTTVRLDRDGQQVARTTFDGEVRVFDVAAGRPRPSLKRPAGGGVSSVNVSPDGRKLVTVESISRQVTRPSNRPSETVATVELKTVLWDTRTAAARPVAEGFAQAAFSPDSRKLVVCTLPFDTSETGVLKLLDADGTQLAELAPADGEVFYRPVISPDSKLLAVSRGVNRGQQPGVLRVYDLSTLKEVAAFPSGGDFAFETFAFSPDSRRVAAKDNKGGVRVWDIAAGRPVLATSFGDDRGVPDVAFVPDGRRLVVFGQPRWDPKEFEREPDPRDLPQPRVFLFDLATPGAAPDILICPHGRRGGLAFSPDGRTLAVGGVGAVHLFDMTDPPGRKR